MLEKEKAKYSPKPLAKVDIKTVTTVKYASPVCAKPKKRPIVKRKVPALKKPHSQPPKPVHTPKKKNRKKLSHERRLAAWKAKQELEEGFRLAMGKPE